MRRNPISFVAAAIILLSAYAPPQMLIAQTVSKTFDIKDFTQIDVSAPADVYVGTGDFSVKVEASQEMLDHLDIRTEGSSLKIGTKKNEWGSWSSHGTFKIYVNLPKLNGMAVAGSGDVYAQNDFTGENLKLAVTGSGNLSMKNITYSSLAVSVSGSGDVSIDGGTASSADFHVVGSGNVKVSKIDGDNASADVAGSGNVNLGKFSKLSVHVAGSGDVSYSGKPASLDKHISGSGDVYEK